jgi:RsiW-degrading membrane proteinase PrsW (M82 family)
MSINLLYALLIGILPSIIWLIFWTREDRHPEPRSLLAACFFGGMLTVLFALFGEKIIQSMGYEKNMMYILWAALEEVLKFIVLIAIAIRSQANDEPIDTAIYCITIALGFAAMENILFIMGPFSQGNVVGGLIHGNMRFLGATLVHAISSACVGFTFGYMFYSNKVSKFLALIVGLVAGIAIHAAFNISILGGESMDILKTFGWVWGAVVLMIVMFEELKAVRPKEV